MLIALEMLSILGEALEFCSLVGKFAIGTCKFYALTRLADILSATMWAEREDVLVVARVSSWCCARAKLSRIHAGREPVCDCDRRLASDQQVFAGER